MLLLASRRVPSTFWDIGFAQGVSVVGTAVIFLEDAFDFICLLFKLLDLGCDDNAKYTSASIAQIALSTVQERVKDHHRKGNIA